jgi:Na+/melibiose symporter-like transporter
MRHGETPGVAVLANASSEARRAGTLIYTPAALLMVMGWMLMADFCLQLMESLPSILPLQVRDFGGSDRTVGFVKDSLPALLAVFLVPFIGVQSDRFRSRLGRRRPFLLWCTPLVCLFLCLIGFVQPIAAAVHSALAPLAPGISPSAVGLVLIAMFAAGFFAVNTYVIQIFYYLIPDVLPRAYMGRFVGIFRAVGAVGGFVFNRYIFRFVDGYVEWVYLGCAALYAAAFLLLVWQVREGDYPPPPEARDGKLVFLRRYFAECFADPFYLQLFGVSLCFWAASVPFNTFVVFYATNSPTLTHGAGLGLSLAAFGEARAWTFLPKIAAALLIGPLIDRFDPLRVLILSLAAMVALYIAAFLLVRTPDQFVAWWILSEAVVTVLLVAYLANFPVLLPADRYGQFFSANQLVFSAGLIAAPVLCGSMLDATGDYRLLYAWSGGLMALSLVLAIRVRRLWIRRQTASA